MTTAALLILLLLVMTLLAVLAKKWDQPQPLVFVVGGIILAFVPGTESIRLHPDYVFFLFLPPLLYASAWMTSWRDFCANLRPISLLAVGLVVITTVSVGFVAHWLIPGLPLAAGMALGAIVSPPDAVAATSILHRLHVPRRLVTVLEGESLVNDASGLVLYRMAVAAALGGVFSTGTAVASFLLVAVGGVVIGLIVGWIFLQMHRRVDDPVIEFCWTLVTPYSAYTAAEAVHCSGVLAVVTAGLFLTRLESKLFSAQTRMSAVMTWDTLVFVLNAVVFLLIGIEVPGAVESVGSERLPGVVLDALIISVVVIVVRFIWVFPASHLPRWFSRKLRERDPIPSWRILTVLSWAGMRGVVSLAAALALPDKFPYRDEILVITTVVILVTLLFSGSTLAPLIRVLGVKREELTGSEERRARACILHAALRRIDALAPVEGLSHEGAHALRNRFNSQLQSLEDPLADLLGWSPQHATAIAQRRIAREAVAAQRAELIALRERGEITDELAHTIERELDLEELGLG